MFRKSKLAALAALALSGAALFGACRATDTAGDSHAAGLSNTAPKASPSVVTQAPAEDARRVTVAELKKMLDEGKAALYDTRPKAAYDAEHIKGALSMPSNEVGERAGELPKGKTLVFYCT